MAQAPSAADFLQGYQPPAPATPPVAGSPSASQFLSQPQFQPPAAVPPASAPALPEVGPLPLLGSWGTRNIGAPLRYVEGKMASGLLQFGQPQAVMQDVEAGRPPPPLTGPRDANQMVFGAPDPQAPGPLSRYAGAAAEALTRDPMFAVMAPEAVIGGAVAGQGAADLGAGSLGQAVAGAVGGGVAGAARAGLGALMHIGATRRLASNLGSSQTRQQAGEVAKAEAESWLTDETNPQSLPAQESRAWAPFDAALPRTTEMPGGPPVALEETEKAFKDILKLGATDPRVSAIAAGTGGGAVMKLFRMLTGENPEAFIPTPPRGMGIPSVPEARIPGGLRPIESGLPEPGRVPGGTLKPIAGPAKDIIDPIEWDSVRNLRTWIGQGMRDPILRNIGEKNLDHLYAALTTDLGETAEAHTLGSLFRQGNAVSEELRTLAEQHIGKIAQAATPEAAWRLAVQDAGTGGTRLSVLRQQLPTTADEVASVHIRQGLQDPKVWNRLSPEAKAQLVEDPTARASVDTAMALPTGDGGGAVRSILGGELGAHIGQAALEGLLGERTGQAVGSVLGAVAPSALHGVRILVGNPASLRYPIIGGLSAPLQDNLPGPRVGNTLLPGR